MSASKDVAEVIAHVLVKAVGKKKAKRMFHIEIPRAMIAASVRPSSSVRESLDRIEEAIDNHPSKN